MTRVAEFDLTALRAALDARRRYEGLSWAAVARALRGMSTRSGKPPMCASTMAGLGARRAAEGDGVLQMLLWLGRSPESFVPGHPLAADPSALLPAVPPGKILRFDTRNIHAALAAQRQALHMTWTAVAKATRCTPGIIHNLSRGAGRTYFPDVMRLTQWLGQPVARFTRAAGN